MKTAEESQGIRLCYDGSTIFKYIARSSTLLAVWNSSNMIGLLQDILINPVPKITLAKMSVLGL